jgi:hypothetical protein
LQFLHAWLNRFFLKNIDDIETIYKISLTATNLKQQLFTLIIASFSILPAFAQNVGIGKTNPEFKLDIAGTTRTDSLILTSGSLLSNTATVDINNLTNTTTIQALNNASGWQSFQPTITGVLKRIRLKFATNNATRVFIVREGIGTGGNILYSGTINTTVPAGNPRIVETAELNIAVVKNNAYTFSIDNTIQGIFTNANSYPNGLTNFNPNIDFEFATIVFHTVPFVSRDSFNNIQIGNANSSFGLNGIAINDSIYISKHSIFTEKNTQISLRESDNANKEWKLEVNNKQMQITEDGVATPFVINPGADNNTLTLGNDTVYTKKLNAQSGVTSTSLKINGNATFNAVDEQIRIIETDNSNKEWKYEVNNGQMQITEDGVATPFVINPGADNNTLTISNDTIFTKKLVVQNGITSNSIKNSGEAIFRSGNDQIKIVETDNANKEWKLEVNNKKLQITEDGIATPIIINAGADDSTITISNDTISIKKIKIGVAGTTIASTKHGSLSIGAQNSPVSTKQVTLTFPNAFTSIPRLVATVQNEDASLNDEFMVTIKSITTTQAVFIIRRLDSVAFGWGQSPILNWWAVE